MEPGNSLPKIDSPALKVVNVSGLTDTKQKEDAKPSQEVQETSVVDQQKSVATQSKQETEKTSSKDQEAVEEAVADLNDFIQSTQRTLAFKMDEDSDRMVVEVTDTNTHEVLRQIPSEEFLQLAKKMEEFKGVIFEGVA